MTITTKLIKELREKTKAGILECKKTLEFTNGNILESIKLLNKKAIIKSIKKINNIVLEGIVKLIIKKNKIVIFEVNSETDFVIKNNFFFRFNKNYRKNIN